MWTTKNDKIPILKDPNLSRHFVFLRSHKINQHSVQRLRPIFLFVIAKHIDYMPNCSYAFAKQHI